MEKLCIVVFNIIIDVFFGNEINDFGKGHENKIPIPYNNMLL